MTKLEVALEAMRLIAEMDDYDSFFLRCDGERAPLTVYARCNDLFFWGSADAEEITEENLGFLEQAYKDADAAVKYGGIQGALLFVARARKERPQGAYYSYFKKELWPLFDACGPEREVGFGNPYAPGEYKRGESA